MAPGKKDSPQQRKAVALRYDVNRDASPRVVAKGRNEMAERIIALAETHGVHVYEDPDLVALLAQLDHGDEIPESLFLAAAEVLAFVYRVGKGV